MQFRAWFRVRWGKNRRAQRSRVSSEMKVVLPMLASINGWQGVNG
jgi:hypothetical protein